MKMTYLTTEDTEGTEEIEIKTKKLLSSLWLAVPSGSIVQN